MKSDFKQLSAFIGAEVTKTVLGIRIGMIIHDVDSEDFKKGAVMALRITADVLEKCEQNDYSPFSEEGRAAIEKAYDESMAFHEVDVQR